MQPARVGPYTLLRVLGEGSLGRVFLGRTDRGARVAIKVFRPEFAVYPQFRTRLREEIDAATLVHSPRVVPVLEADTEAEVPWLATEYVPAPPLHEVVSGRGPLGVGAVRQLGIGLADALTAVHHTRWVHGDLKPGNVLLAADGPRLTDVGLARAAATTPVTRGGALVGTLGYLAPEQIVGGAAGPASDVFALGSVLLFAATWRRPFGDGDATAVLHRVLNDDPDLSGLTPDIATVVAACLTRDPVRRPGLAQVRETLLVAASTDALPAPAASVPVPVPGKPRGLGRPPAPRTLSRARRIASATAVSLTLVGLLAVTAADTSAVPRADVGVQAGR